MRIGLLFLAGLALSACASPGPGVPPMPLTFAGGFGSALGNYPSVETDQVWRDERGSPCPVFHWDRPLGAGRALRLVSAVCPVPGRPGVFLPRDLGRTIVPIAESRLAVQTPPEPPPRDPVARSAPVPPVVRGVPLS